MNKKNLSGILSTAVMAVAIVSLASCSEKKFHINGTITQAKDSTLYLENMSLNGPVAVDSVKLDENGNFDFSQKAPEAPEFYRLRIANQMVNLAVDSTENITVKAAYPTMTANYEVSGSEECAKIRELAYMQLDLQTHVTAIANSATLGVQAVEDSVAKVLEGYKNKVKLN